MPMREIALPDRAASYLGWRSIRRGVPYIAALGGVALVTVALRLCTIHWALHLRIVPVIYLLYVLFVASGWGRGPAIAATLGAAAALDYFFLPPVYTFVTTPEHWLLLIVFLLTGVIAGHLSGLARRRAMEAEAGRAEIGRLYGDLEKQAREYQRQAQLLDLVHDAIIVKDAQSRITFWNQGAAERYGWSKQEALGKVTHDLLRTEFPEPLEEILEQLRRKRFWEGELVHTCRGGERVVVASRWVWTADNAHETGTVLEINNDITARKQAEGNLRRARDELESRVLERTSDLTKSNQMLELEVAERRRTEMLLAQRSRELARSNTELQQFAYVASHDLQEPLRMVGSYVLLLERNYSGLFNAEGKEYIHYAVDGVKRMQMLIDDLLAYSRVGCPPVNSAPADSASAVSQAIANLQNAIDESGAQITCGPLPKVPADGTQLLQLFQNLISNAIKFRGEEAPEIQIRAERVEGGWQFAVQDNGIGIGRQDFDRIFLIFQRLHGRRHYPGTGIGLAICRKIVNRHEGKIWVESEPGKGSTFFFTLPDRAREDGNG
jgi:PAS domain S-box-containing protein